MPAITESFCNALCKDRSYSLKELKVILTAIFRKEEKANKSILCKDSKHMSKNVTKILTEDTGKVFEMAICLAYCIRYDGSYKYDMHQAGVLSQRLAKLTELFPMCSHTAKMGARYDFTGIFDKDMHLSAKTAKKGGGKVAPQVIGQSQPQKFCDTIGIAYEGVAHLKRHIQENIKKILPILVDYTFDCSNLYYNKEKDTIKFITLNEQIDWEEKSFVWTCNSEEWNNSSTLKISHDGKDVSLVEFQFHTKSRTNMAIRWFYENFLHIFEQKLSITSL